jgi:hypothetical protein
MGMLRRGRGLRSARITAANQLPPNLANFPTAGEGNKSMAVRREFTLCYPFGGRSFESVAPITPVKHSGNRLQHPDRHLRSGKAGPFKVLAKIVKELRAIR